MDVPDDQRGPYDNYLMTLSARLDGTPITRYCQSIRWRPRFTDLHCAVIRFPGYFLSALPGQTLEIQQDGLPIFNGGIWMPEASGEVDAAYVEATAWDWSISLRKRMCKQGEIPGQPSDPDNMVDISPVIDHYKTAPEIAAHFVEAALTDPLAEEFDPSGPFGPTGPSKALPVVVGDVETGGVDLTGTPMAFPMTIDRMFQLLQSTGQLIVERVPGDGVTILNFRNPYENDLSGSVVYSYGTGLHNAQNPTYTLDLDDLINALWYLVGRRRNDGRWPGSITPTAPNKTQDWPEELLERISDSRIAWGYGQEVQILDDAGDENAIREMFEERWANESWIRAVPREFASVVPQRGTQPNFAVGDTIGVAGGTTMNGGFSGAQRVYGFDLTQDADGVITWDDITTSADQEGAVPVGE